jgi:DNA-nicking Smr family endonuclease
MKREIDLHGIRHENVKRTLDIFFWEMMQRDIKRFSVITGFSQRMKDIVIETSSEYGFKVKEDISNGGLLIIEI